MINKKTIVLTGVNDESKRAVLTLESLSGGLNGRLRLYNFTNEPHGILSLGLTCDQKVYKAGLTREGNMLFTFGMSIDQIPQDFSCAIINFVGGEPNPILYGSSEGSGNLEKTLGDVVNSLQRSKNVEDIENTLDNFGLDYEEDLKQEIEQEIDKNMEIQSVQEQQDCNKDCSNCMYKKYFYSHQNEINIFSNSQEKQANSQSIDKEETKKAEELNFYSQIRGQVETLFSQNKPEEFLESAFIGSKWVKVEIDESGDYYVFGLIYEDEVLKYVCYGVPGLYSNHPPKQLSGFPVWFPLDKDKREGFGYWLSYQDASTGESVKAIVD